MKLRETVEFTKLLHQQTENPVAKGILEYSLRELEVALAHENRVARARGLPDPSLIWMEAYIDRASGQFQTITAIKAYRQLYDCGLKEAKDAIVEARKHFNL